jgi:hypothetical protein
VPAVATEPLIVGEVKFRPAGRFVALNEVGEFEAVIVYVNDAFAATLAVSGLVMTGAETVGADCSR